MIVIIIELLISHDNAVTEQLKEFLILKNYLFEHRIKFNESKTDKIII